MPKKKQTVEKHDEEHKHDRKIQTIAVTLLTGRWKKVFTDQQYKVLIAEALNGTVKHAEFRHTLIGYLITTRRVCLVLETEKRSAEKFLHLFYEEVRSLIRHHFKNQYGTKWEEHIRPLISVEDWHAHLFEEINFVNYELVQLLLGKNVTLPYYSPNLERMKDYIRNYPFCSAINYSGAIGPVRISLSNQNP